MILKYWEALREAVQPEFFSPLHCQVTLREILKHPLQEGTLMVGEQPVDRTLEGRRGTIVDFSWHSLPTPFSLGHFCEKGIF